MTQKTTQKTREGPTSRHEQDLCAAERERVGTRALVAGLDEVGRGAWAGPVTVGLVVWQEGIVVQGVRDSKLLSPQRRVELANEIRDCLPYGVGHASNVEVDELGMNAALRLASLRALLALEESFCVVPSHLIVDGTQNFLAGVLPAMCLPKADTHCVSVAMASVLAKAMRDAQMVTVSEHYPVYAFAENKGYPAPVHRRALEQHGPCVLHRHSWAPLRALAGAPPFRRVFLPAPGPVRLPLASAPTLF